MAHKDVLVYTGDEINDYAVKHTTYNTMVIYPALSLCYTTLLYDSVLAGLIWSVWEVIFGMIDHTTLSGV